MVKKETLGISIKNVSEADKNYNYKGLIDSKIKSILEDKTISERNKEFIIKFLQSCINESLSNARISFYADKLKVLVKILKKDFDKCERVDLEAFISEICKRYDKAETRRTYIITLKKLYRYLTSEENPEIISWIKGKNYNKTAKRQNEQGKIDNILTPEEVEKMIAEAKTPRDRALVGLIYYSAGRIGEIIIMKNKDIVFDDYRTIVGLFGKTGYRKIPVIECSKLLKDWMEYHPDKNNKDAYVWTNFNNVNRIKNLNAGKKNKQKLSEPGINPYEHIGVRYVSKLLEQLGESAGVDKKVNPHNFRHSRLTHLSLMGIDGDLLKLYAGHSKNSNVTSTYKHFSFENLNEGMEKMLGIKTDEKSNELISCFRCGHLNRNTLEVCENCGFSLSVKQTGKLDKKQSKEVALRKIMGAMIDDDLFKKVMARYIIDKGLVDFAKKLAEDEK
jgi:integrase/recombinase XerD